MKKLEPQTCNNCLCPGALYGSSWKSAINSAEISREERRVELLGGGEGEGIMDEEEFQRILDLFPIVRPRDYHIGMEPARQSSSGKVRQNEALKEWQDAPEQGHEEEAENQAVDPNDAFWKKLKLAAEKKVGAAEAERFCKAFQRVHKKLVHEELSLDAARRFMRLSEGYRK